MTEPATRSAIPAEGPGAGPDPFALRNPGLRAAFGVARTDLTPPPDTPITNWGAATTDRADGIAAPLTGTVLAVVPPGEPAQTVVLVGLDLGWWRTQQAAHHVRENLARALDLPVAQVLVSLSHTHAGPTIDPAAVPPEAAAEVETYLSLVTEHLVDAAHRAVASAETGLLDWGRSSCHLARVRDQWVPAESRYVCGYDPAGQPDATLLVGRLTSPDGTLRGVLVNYACHPTTLGPENTAISGDFVGAARRLVERALGVPMLFLQGASGDLAPRRQYAAGTDEVESNGAELGYAVLSGLAGMLPPGTRLVPGTTVESGAPLGVWQPVEDTTSGRTVMTMTRAVPLDRNRREASWGSRASEANPRADAERVRRAALIASVTGTGPTYGLPVTAVRLGDVLLVSQPGEAYSAWQRDLRAAFPGHAVVVANLTGGAHHGYLPPTWAYEHDLYAVWQTPAGPGSLERLLAASTDLVRELLASTDLPSPPATEPPTEHLTDHSTAAPRQPAHPPTTEGSR